MAAAVRPGEWSGLKKWEWLASGVRLRWGEWRNTGRAKELEERLGSFSTSPSPGAGERPELTSVMTEM